MTVTVGVLLMMMMIMVMMMTMVMMMMMVMIARTCPNGWYCPRNGMCQPFPCPAGNQKSSSW